MQNSNGVKAKAIKMGTTINQIIAAFRTYNSQILSDKNIKNLSDKIFSDTLSDEIEKNNSVSIKVETDKGTNRNRIKHSTTDENKVVVQVIRDESGKIIRTIPLNEQHALDFFE